MERYINMDDVITYPVMPVEYGDDGSGNLFKIKIQPCDWTIWGWSYFRKPEVLAWMPLPKFDIGEITNEMR